MNRKGRKRKLSPEIEAQICAWAAQARTVSDGAPMSTVTCPHGLNRSLVDCKRCEHEQMERRLKAEAERDAERAIALGKTWDSFLDQLVGGKR